MPEFQIDSTISIGNLVSVASVLIGALASLLSAYTERRVKEELLQQRLAQLERSLERKEAHGAGKEIPPPEL